MYNLRWRLPDEQAHYSRYPYQPHDHPPLLPINGNRAPIGSREWYGGFGGAVDSSHDHPCRVPSHLGAYDVNFIILSWLHKGGNGP